MPSSQQLSEMADDVLYEIGEFRRSVAALGDIGTDNEAWNRTLESALIHFRVLRGFFIDKPGGDDVSARHYLAAWSPNPDPIFKKTEVDLNKKLAHLTWSRKPWTPPQWDVAAMKAAIERLFEEFKNALTPPARDWFNRTGPSGISGLSNGNSTVSVAQPMLLSLEQPAAIRIKNT